MPGGVTFLTSADADIPTPPANKVTVYFSTSINAPAYKDSSGVVHSLVGPTGAAGPLGPAIPLLDTPAYDDHIMGNPKSIEPDFFKFAETLLTADTATVTFSGIPTGFRHILLMSQVRNDNAGTGSTDGYMQFNGDTGANYYRNFLGFVNTTVNAGQTIATAKCPAFFAVNNGAAAGLATSFNTLIYNYSNTSFIKNATTAMIAASALSSGNILGNDVVFSWNSAAAINSILLGMTDTSKFKAGSIFSLYLMR